MKEFSTWGSRNLHGKKGQANENATPFFTLSYFDWLLLKGQPMVEGLKECAKTWEVCQATCLEGWRAILRGKNSVQLNRVQGEPVQAGFWCILFLLQKWSWLGF